MCPSYPDDIDIESPLINIKYGPVNGRRANGSQRWRQGVQEEREDARAQGQAARGDDARQGKGPQAQATKGARREPLDFLDCLTPPHLSFNHPAPEAGLFFAERQNYAIVLEPNKADIPLKNDNTRRINEAIRAGELRVIGPEGENFGVLSRDEALKRAQDAELDLIEISPAANPPVGKIMDYGKYLYLEKKKQKSAKAKSHTTETKSIQVKIGTGEHDLALKAKKASEWLKEGHRVKVELYLRGRSKYMEQSFLDERVGRVLKLITEDYRISEPLKKNPKGIAMVIEKAKQKNENE